MIDTDRMTIGRRIEALPTTDQSLILSYIDFLEWRDRLPTRCGERGSKARRELGARLRQVREALNETEDEAAEAASVRLVTYQAYELGKIGRWSTKHVLGYCDAWNVSLDWLMDGDGEMFRGGKPPVLEPKPQPTRHRAGPPTSPKPSNILHFPAVRP